MKRFIVLLSALFLLLSLCACSASPGSNGNTETTAALTVNLANTGLPFYSLSELESYLAEHDLEEDVLSYDKLSAVGAFNNFMFPQVLRNDSGEVTVLSYSRYIYSFTDAADNSVDIFIKPATPENTAIEIDALSDVDINPLDMRTLPVKTTGFYTYGQIQYVYVDGVLSGIQWTADGLLFSVVTSPSIHQYPLNVETFASSLLTLETAAATIALIDPAE